MTDLYKLVAAAYLPLRETAVNVVADAFVIGLAAPDHYIESEVTLEALDLASFATSGLAAAADDPEPGEVRTSSRVVLPLADSGGQKSTAESTVTLYGPGDVIRLDPGSIIRRHPAPTTQTAEVTDLAHIEFDRPELPWAFSAVAARASKVMRPWLTLIVVRQSVVQWDSIPGLPPRLFVPPSELPDLENAHLWGHAQAARSGASLPARLSPEHAPINLSRLVSPRVLEPDTDYVAALVPTTDVGVQRGLGTGGGTLDKAWRRSSPDTVVLPVYDRWEFRTGPAGDFATLALRLVGVAAPWEVGRRAVDISSPGDPMKRTLTAGETGTKQVLRCALFSPSKPPNATAKAKEEATWPDDMVDELAGKLNRAAELGGVVANTADEIPDLPIVGPRLYARAQRGEATVGGYDWFAQLNLSPVNRIVAGLGTRVVQREQEQLMAAAWTQIGEVQKANRAIALAQLAEQVAVRLHMRIGDFHQGHLLQVVAPVAPLVSVNAGRTLAADIAASATPVATVSGAFRRALRPGGPVVRRAADATKLAGTIVGTDAGMRDFTRRYTNPDGIEGLSAVSIATLDTARVSAVLDVPEGKVATTLNKASANMKGGLFAHLADATTWSNAPAGFDAATMIATGWRDAIVTESRIPVVEKIRRQRVGPLAAELAVSAAPAILGIKSELESAAIKYNNSVITTVTTTPTSGVDPVIRRKPGRSSETVGRISMLNRITTAGTGRLATGVPGVSVIDASALQRITTRTSANATSEALKHFARLAPVQVTPLLERARATSAARLRAMIPELLDPGGVMAIPPVAVRAPVAVGDLVAALDPRRTVREALRGRLSAAIDNGWLSDVSAPIMAAPQFHRPMFEALQDFDEQWLLPGLEYLPDDDFVTVLSMNSAFVEAFLVGLSDEFGRELLWRGYPTDQCGTYFTRFWSSRSDELRSPIHRFARTDLGTHLTIDGPEGAERAVIVVKGDLVRRYPDAIIRAAKKSGKGPTTRFDPADQLFAARLGPDTVIVCIDLSVAEMTSGGWWVLISEHPTATRFDRADNAQGSFLGTGGMTDAAAWAQKRVHQPVHVAFPATDVIKQEG
ncbi:hypothetical protein [Rhodococcus sp. NCIMB 12038]|uniref:hypothetical protein n=1 Tax=Rhodococcus sp. NCIMB 12038 TaxID=933800 RepID=UPI000B3BEEE5|nr:hypothetical protein [Rhodococcus sp. NCIMB 12038]OUS97410.1 hypothetical protein CA951_03450 [Rhodococcus sp. NCIMB 12038]